MNIIKFLKDKSIFLFTQIFIICFTGVMLSVFHVGNQAIILICLTLVFATFFSVMYEYVKKKRYYKRMYNTLEGMDKKQYILELMEEPDFFDAEILYDVLKQTTKAMNDTIAAHEIAEREYREYIETWIHEVKLPIACIDLICKNNRNELTNSINAECRRIDSFIEQALYYARSNTVEKDYSIRELRLDELVKTVVKKYSKELISCKCELSFENLNYIIFSDSKWIQFILGQIVSNSIKYRNEEFSLSFVAKENEKQILLSIKDNGIGIPIEDVDRVFEKGFTGENGRKFAKSTGIGLYLCKKLCDKLHLGIELDSKEGGGTHITIAFPKDKALLFQ